MSAAPSLARRLVAWQRQHGRHGLPWQGTRDPYRVWLSEIMLQQTQVSTVLAYYPRFLARFPDVQALARAHLDDVLALWSGLGYYSRARNMHRCAMVVVGQHGGRFPRSSQALIDLPGIGRSTAAAIAAFCHGERAAILDGNVKRVLTRVLGFGADLAEAANERALWQHAQDMLPAQDMAAYTQGLMDLGATLCTQRRPACTACPWRSDCVALAQGRQELLPVKTRKLKRSRRDNALLHLRWTDQVWLVPRPATGIWAGLWTLPELPDPQGFEQLTASWPGQGHVGSRFKHQLTHLDWWLTPCHWRLPESVGDAPRQQLLADWPEGRWFSEPAALAAGIAAPIRKLLIETAAVAG